MGHVPYAENRSSIRQSLRRDLLVHTVETYFFCTFQNCEKRFKIHVFLSETLQNNQNMHCAHCNHINCGRAVIFFAIMNGYHQKRLHFIYCGPHSKYVISTTLYYYDHQR